MKQKWLKALACTASVSVLAGALTLGAFAAETPQNGMDENGYYVYYITTKDYDAATRTVHIDGTGISDAISQRQFSGKTYWMPGDKETAKVRFVNTLPYELKMTGWEAKIPGYNVSADDIEKTTGTGATGKDGNIIPIQLNPIRTVNAAIKALYGNKSNYTLMDLLTLEDKIHEVYGPNVSYADYLCIYYNVASLADLTVAQKTQIFNGTTFFSSKNLGDMSGYPEDAEIFRYAFQSGSSYYGLETDRDVIELGYNFYLSDSLVGFSMDESIAVLNPLSSTGLVGYEMGKYLDQNSEAWKATNAFASAITLGAAGANNDSYSFDSIQYAISAPLTVNAFQLRDVPNILSFTLQTGTVDLPDPEPPLEPPVVDPLPPVDLPDEDLPLAPPEQPSNGGTTELPDEETPLAPPKTGDTFALAVAAAILLLSGMAAVLVRVKKQNSK